MQTRTHRPSHTLRTQQKMGQIQIHRTKQSYIILCCYSTEQTQNYRKIKTIATPPTPAIPEKISKTNNTQVGPIKLSPIVYMDFYFTYKGISHIALCCLKV
ncbi:hypothetical protein CHS0354_011826 [Potamilus streckersoni]|uniref:Uncharacterized protein n=1 Tax=Potamilus streckersoni TaxID=2493646 RepID=A0AAE0THG1_9BIVA|nr:hypothetical protein CHS0354_011826 [Potamilus streckersoni]